MIFSDPQFLLFFLVYGLLHTLIPSKFRIYLIIAGGAVFYAWWRADYLWVPLGLGTVAYFGTLWIDDVTGTARKRRMLLVTAALFAPLLLVKYSSFFVEDVLGIFLNPDAIVADPGSIHWTLPLGISFITFTAAAYVIDVYRAKFASEKSLAMILGHILFFPHLVAGPILRPNELLPQLHQLRPATGARILLGTSIFTLGLVKKLVIADQIAPIVEAVYDGSNPLTAWHYIAAIYGFSVQIYCDFSGYTDMAIGLAYLLRIRLPTNFLRPYGASSLSEFWRRWHVSLSSWLRDYLYIPLGGNRNGRPRQILNLFVTMVLGGLWHGASWTFVLWGMIHGAGLGLVHGLKSRAALPRWLGVAITFHFVTLAWIFFRASDMTTVKRVITGPIQASYDGGYDFLLRNAFPLAVLVTFAGTHWLDRHARLRWASSHLPKLPQWGVVGLLWILAIAVSQGSSAKFIYFDF